MTALRRTLTVAALGATLALSSCQRSSLQVTTIQMNDVAVAVEIADSVESRARGLMYRDKVKPGTGMLFIYPEDAPRSFWMKDTRVPLSIAFINRSGKILRIRDMTPLSKKPVKSLYPVPYAVEVGKGWFAEVGIKEGDVVTGLPLPSTAN